VKCLKSKWIVLIVAVIVIFILIYASLFLLILLPFDSSEFIPGPGRIAVIRIEGAISVSGAGDGLLSGAGASSDSIIAQLRKAAKDSSVKAILLRVNSPGGTAAASEEILVEVKKIRKPVVVSIGEIGASGAYLVSSATDRIIANTSSSVGSIGVIVTIPNLEELYKKVGVQYVIVSKGKYKSLGHPARPLTEEEKDILEKQADVSYRYFITNVARGRKMSRRQVKEIANGLTFPGKQAKEMGLVDQIGNYQDAVDQCAKMGKIKGEPEIVEYEAQGLPRWLSQIFQGKGAWFLRILAPRYLLSSPVTNF
jgi:protease-4